MLMDSISIGMVGSVSGFEDDACQMFVLVALYAINAEPCDNLTSRSTPVCLSQ